MSPTEQPGNLWSARPLLLWGFFTLAVLVLGIGTWSVKARIAGAIVSSGLIEVASNRQVVQHLEGGVVSAIYVEDGDSVSAGDVLLQLDATLLHSELAIVEGQLFEVMARQARLIAERDDAGDITFKSELHDVAKGDAEVRNLLAGQERLFQARKITMIEETSRLRERVKQVLNQIVGTEAQLIAIRRQRELVQQDLRSQQELFGQGLTQAAQVSGLEREEASLSGKVGELEAGIAQARGQIAEIEIEMLRLKSSLREEAITSLRDLQYNEVELRERRLSLRERVARLDIRAPRSGIVYGMQVHALRSVVTTAEPVLFIVPQDTSLVTTARIAANDIDQVEIGQRATLRFSAFDMRTTPEIIGRVVKISADIFTDEMTGASYYTVELLPAEGELAKLEGKTLLPGMPVEVFLKTGDRSPLNYILKPLAGYFNRAFREE